MSQQSELILLKQYSQKLEDENRAKTEQIKLLREQLSRQRQNASNTRIVSATYTNVNNCQNCRNKDSQLLKVNQNVKRLSKELDQLGTRYRLLESKEVKQKIVYRDVVKQVESSKSKQDNQRIRRQCDSLRNQVQSIRKQLQNERKTSELDRKQHNRIKQLYELSTSKNQQQVEWTSIKVDSNDKQLNLLKQDNAKLMSRIQFLEQRLVAAEESNRIFREDIIGKANYSTHFSSPFAYPVGHERPRVWLTTHAHPETPYLNVQQPIPQQATHQIPTFRNLPQKSVKFQIPNSSSLPNFTNEQVHVSHLSPLSVLNNHHKQHCHGHHHHHHHSNNIHSRSHNDLNMSSDNVDYYKDIVEQRWRSLQYKIKMLEQENGKLRSEVSAVYI